MSESINITLPADSLEGTTAKVSHWLVAEGDQVTQGMPLLELETDKVTMEVCADADGVIAKIMAAPGEDVAEGVTLGLISGHNTTAAQPVAEPPTEAPVAAPQATTELVDIELPADQLEGTAAKVAAWHVEIGTTVKAGDPVIELETDKVTMEITAPADGILMVKSRQIGEEVEAGSILGQLQAGSATAAPAQSAAPTQTAAQTTAPAQTAAQTNAPAPASAAVASEITGERSARHLIGPVVRRLLKEHQLNIDLITGSGRGGRVTRDDVLAYLKSPQAQQLAPAVAPAAKPAVASVAPQACSDIPSRMVPHTSMRKAIANHMVDSLLHTSPHVTSVFEMDMGNIIEHRKQCKMGFNEAGVNLTFTAYFLSAAAKAMEAVPAVNARFHEEALEIFEDVNIGVGTALGDDGLVVPVVRKVQDMNLFQIATALQQQTERARSGKLTAADMKGGTFTISNHGVSGSLFATPIIINQPQVAILGIGKLEKRVVVETINGEDEMRIRPKCYVSLSIDHRALDAFQTNLFLSRFVEIIENWGN